MHELCLDPGLWTEFIIDCLALHQFSPQILSFATRMVSHKQLPFPTPIIQKYPPPLWIENFLNAYII